MKTRFLKSLLALFALSGCKPIVHDLATYAQIALPEGWHQELNTTAVYISEAEMKLSPKDRERRRPQWDQNLNSRELTFYFTKNFRDTMGGRVVPSILRVTLFNPKLTSLEIPQYLELLANKSFHHDGVGGLATRQFTKIADNLWKSEFPNQRIDFWGLTDVTERWYILDNPVQKVRILFNSQSDLHSDEESQSLIKEVMANIKLNDRSSYFDGPLPYFKPFYISENSEPFIPDAEIEFYDWKNQILYLKREPGTTGFRNVNLGDEVLYRFEIISPLSARAIATPVAYSVTIGDRPALVLRPEHDFLYGLKPADSESRRWKPLLNEKIRIHFSLLDKLKTEENPAILQTIFR